MPFASLFVGIGDLEQATFIKCATHKLQAKKTIDPQYFQTASLIFHK